MDFVFTCPRANRIFKSDKFEITNNHGVKTDAAGNRTLDAMIRLITPCPFCGSRHIYHASELACPFTGQG